MRILEYGNVQKEKVILINGFQLPLICLNEYIEKLKEKYCVIVPILPGHDLNIKEDFLNFDKCLEEFEDYYIKKYGNNVYAIIGFSMGGVFASYIWKNKKINVKKIIMESSPILKWNKFLIKLITRQYLMLSKKVRNRDKKILNYAIKTIILEKNLESFLKLLDNMTDETICRYIKCVGDFNLPKDIDTPNIQIYYSYGGNFSEFIFRKVSKYLQKYYKNTHIRCINKKGHCEDVIFNSNEKINEILAILNNKI